MILSPSSICSQHCYRVHQIKSHCMSFALLEVDWVISILCNGRFCRASSSSMWQKCFSDPTFLRKGCLFRGAMTAEKHSYCLISQFREWVEKKGRPFLVSTLFLPGMRKKANIWNNFFSTHSLADQTIPMSLCSHCPPKQPPLSQKSWVRKTFLPHAATWSSAKSCHYTKWRLLNQHLAKQTTCNVIVYDVFNYNVGYRCLMATVSCDRVHSLKANHWRTAWGRMREMNKQCTHSAKLKVKGTPLPEQWLSSCHGLAINEL